MRPTARRRHPLALVALGLTALVTTVLGPPPPATAAGVGSPSAVPTVTAVTPAGSPAAGGTAVTITGTGFVGVTGVRFGAGNPALSFVVDSDTQIRTVAPPSPDPDSAVTVNVFVDAIGGTSAATTSAWFRYTPPPVILSVTPASGPTAGGQRVEVAYDPGTTFAVPPQARIAGIDVYEEYPPPAPGVLAFTTPPHTAGQTDITLHGVGGTSTPAAYTYVETTPPAVSSVSPRQGPIAGGTVLTITGTGFTGATGVRVGGAGVVGGPATSFTVVSDTQITAVTPPSADHGTVNVHVDTPSGSSAAGTQAWFTYLTPPTVSTVAPSSGLTTGGQVVTITGTLLTGVDRVLFGDTEATTFTVLDDRTITATAPAHPAGAVALRVHHPTRGLSSVGIPKTFTFADVATPVVTRVAPNRGPAVGGDQVVITGTGFTAASGVRFGATNPAISFTVESDTRIVATAPPTPGPIGATTLVNVFVDGPGGTSSNTMASWYRYEPTPAITGVSPNKGPAGGGTSVTISGSGFTGATAVHFGIHGGLAPSFTVVNDSTIVATSPAQPPNTLVTIFVDGVGGQSAAGSAAWFYFRP